MIKKLFITMVFFSFIFSFCYSVFAVEDNLEIYAPSAILMDSSSGKILYEKNIHEKMYPASLTKILTAIMVLENCNLEEICTVSYDAVMSIEYGYVSANLQIGEQLTVEQLLNLIMVASSNDASVVLAEHVSGSSENFVELMNQKAMEIGCLNTHFTNPSGIHDENHYSTAYDLALIGKYAMKNETFRNLSKKTFYQLPATNKHENNDRLFTTTNELLISNNNNRSDNYYYKYATGMKTGFTTPAGNCLMASCTKDGFSFISVVLHDGLTRDGLNARYIDTKNLFEFGYSNFSLKQIAKNGDTIQTVSINNATPETQKLDLVIDDDIYVTVPSEMLNSSITPKIEITADLKAPISRNSIVGKISYEADGITYSANLLASHDVEASRVFLKFVLLFIFIVVLLGFLRLRKNFLKKKRLNMIKK